MTEAPAAVQDRSFAPGDQHHRQVVPAGRAAGGPAARELPRPRLFAVIGSRPRRPPHAAMFAFVWRGTAFWPPTAAGLVRERNVHGEP
jgi:hypothetical protein